jgi:endonuclease G, mitochondrial
MKKIIILLALFFITNTSFIYAENENLWYPDPSIVNIQLVELYTFNGLPKNTNSDRDIKILVNHGYAVGYSEELKVPLYVTYRYGNLSESSEEVQERSFKRPPKFQVDLRTNSKVHTNDYTGSGYDRGHMAPNYGIRTQYGHLSQIETFLMTNIVPQDKSLNRYTWVSAEKKVANTLAQDDRDPDDDGDDIPDLWVISGPIFEGEIEHFGEKQIAIPDAFYKIIVRQKSYYDSSAEAIAIYYPHKPKDGEEKEQFVSVDFIEEKTGLDFHPNFIDKYEEKMEGKIRDWNWNKIED